MVCDKSYGRTVTGTCPGHDGAANGQDPAYAPARRRKSRCHRWGVTAAARGSSSNIQRPKQSVQIVSQPSGAKIEVNGRSVGDAPTTVEIEVSPHGRFWRDTIIKAYPKDTGYIQIKAFNGESRWSISDLIPARISFDTRIDPAAALNETNGR